jgi:hypothetical protein
MTPPGARVRGQERLAGLDNLLAVPGAADRVPAPFRSRTLGQVDALLPLRRRTAATPLALGNRPRQGPQVCVLPQAANDHHAFLCDSPQEAAFGRRPVGRAPPRFFPGFQHPGPPRPAWPPTPASYATSSGATAESRSASSAARRAWPPAAMPARPRPNAARPATA